MSLSSIYLHGFRATGKSTLAPVVAGRLGWNHIDMDSEIVRRAGMTVTELTEDGKRWDRFRTLEHALLVELLERDRIVVCTGGGLTVNDVVCDADSPRSITYGALNAEALGRSSGVLSVLLTAADEVIEARLRAIAMATPDMGDRPPLGADGADRADRADRADGAPPVVVQTSAIRRHEVLAEARVQDSMSVYRCRKALYAAVATLIIDTDERSVEQAAARIVAAVEARQDHHRA